MLPLLRLAGDEAVHALRESIDALAEKQTPEESLETAYQKVRRGLATELLQTIKSFSPEFFEQLVVNVLLKMGYGDSRKEAGQALGRSGDGGIDGIIKEDRPGLDIIHIQAKRWDTNNTVGRPEVQKFAGALQGHRAKKGIFITTSDFSREALNLDAEQRKIATSWATSAADGSLLGRNEKPLQGQFLSEFFERLPGYRQLNLSRVGCEMWRRQLCGAEALPSCRR